MNASLVDTLPMPSSEGRKSTVLIVDDDSTNRSLLADMIGPDYRIFEAENGKKAAAILQKFGTAISLVLLDINMPKMGGFDVLELMNSRALISEIPVIMVASETDSDLVEQAFSLGATDFITRPFDQSIVSHRVHNAIMLFAKQKTLVSMVAEGLFDRERENNIMVAILSHIVEFRNGESGLHVLHIGTLTELLLNQVAKKTDKYNLTPTTISRMSLASSLHDIGKITIPGSILNKPGKLNDEEYKKIKNHAAAGARMLEELPVGTNDPLVHTAYEICKWHHERYDGNGYPDGLVGDDIPIAAQAVSLADVYDALTSERVYKDAVSHEEAVRMITSGECGAFNPVLLESFLDIAEELPQHLKNENYLHDKKQEIMKLLNESVRNTTDVASSRTLKLIDYERMKYNFFATMSNELQFEYSSDTGILIISDWSDEKLNLPEVIEDPVHSEVLLTMLGSDNLQTIIEKLKETTPDNPIMQMDFQALVNGDPRWFQITARANWDPEDTSTFIGALGKVVDIHESREHMINLEHHASHDSLTGLYNHATARRIIEERMSEYPDRNFVFVVLDMDYFKQINDTYGHQVGDTALIHLAERLEGSVRADDIVARVGGDEFFLCLERVDPPQPLIKRIHEALVGKYDGLDVSISMGVACAHGDEQSYEELFRRADNALYEVKRGGRGTYKFSETSGNTEEPSMISAIDSE